MQMQNDANMTIRLARPGDLAMLASVERAAASVFATVGMVWIADGGTLSLDDLESWQRDGTLWVAVDGADVPVGFLAAHEFDGALFIAELDVVPEQQGRGLGRLLLQAAHDYARAQGYSAMTLTTYRDIAWNGPFYKRFGFMELQPGPEFPRHAAKLAAETAAGHDPAQRCMMLMALPAS